MLECVALPSGWGWASPAMFVAEWPDDHVAALKKHFASGLSFAQIAAKVNAECGSKYTRNACIGKAKRIGLSQAEKPKPQPRREKREPMVQVRKPSRVPKIAPEEIELRVANIVPHNISIYELTDATCKWPYGSAAPYEFCGCKTYPGFPYCAEHAALSVGRGTDSERRAHQGVVA